MEVLRNECLKNDINLDQCVKKFSNNYLELFTSWGNDLTNFNHQKLAGMGLAILLQERAAKTNIEYVKIFDSFLSKRFKTFLLSDLGQHCWSYLVPERDYQYDYGKFLVLTKTYLIKISFDSPPMETPQQMFLRTAIDLWLVDEKNYTNLTIISENLSRIKSTYDCLSTHKIMHATPTLSNSGKTKNNKISCFLSTVSDSTESIIEDGIRTPAEISRAGAASGLRLVLRHSAIRGVENSAGTAPVVGIIEKVISYFDQLGQRKGACTVYLDAFHIDFIEFIDLLNTHGSVEKQIRNLTVGVLIPDLFMKRYKENKSWTMFCPNKVGNLFDLTGKEFEERYEYYEKLAIEREQEYQAFLKEPIDQTNPEYWKRKAYIENRLIVHKTSHPNDILQLIAERQLTAGEPFIIWRDPLHRKSNQQHLGTITHTNLCVEICLYTGPDEDGDNTIPSCNLGSLVIASYVKSKYDGDFKKCFDFPTFVNCIQLLTYNLNQVIQTSHYPLSKYNRDGELIQSGKIEKTNKRFRPIGIGQIGIASALMKMGLSYESEEAKQFELIINSCIYFNSLYISNRLAKINKEMFDTAERSELIKGNFQFDLWRQEREKGFRNWNLEFDQPISPIYWGDEVNSWEKLRNDIQKSGVVNSEVTAIMPTATTSLITGYTESIEPMVSLYYIRNTISGRIPIYCKEFFDYIEEIGYKDKEKEIIDYLIENNGEIEGYFEGTSYEKEVNSIFKNKWEISQRTVMERSALRGRYISMTQSLNLSIAVPSIERMKKIIEYGYDIGLKTGNYYIRTRVKSDNINHRQKKPAARNDLTEKSVKTEPIPQIPQIFTNDCEACS